MSGEPLLACILFKGITGYNCVLALLKLLFPPNFKIKLLLFRKAIDDYRIKIKAASQWRHTPLNPSTGEAEADL